jgi:hypothetical protein
MPSAATYCARATTALQRGLAARIFPRGQARPVPPFEIHPFWSQTPPVEWRAILKVSRVVSRSKGGSQHHPRDPALLVEGTFRLVCRS